MPAVRRTKLPFPINLIWNIKAFYFVFMVVMIASLAAVGLAPSLGGGGSSKGAPVDEGSPAAEETATGLLTFDKPEKTIDTTKAYNAVITTDKGEIVVALSKDAPQAANSLAFLSGQNFYDGLQFFWVLPGFDAQAGDPTCRDVRRAVLQRRRRPRLHPPQGGRRQQGRPVGRDRPCHRVRRRPGARQPVRDRAGG